MKEAVTTTLVGKENDCQAIKSGSLVYISAQLPLVQGELIAADASSQIEQAFANFRWVLEASNGSPEQVVKVTVYLTDMKYLSQVSEKMKLCFPRPWPACTVLQVAALPEFAQIAVEGVADITEFINQSMESL